MFHIYIDELTFYNYKKNAGKKRFTMFILRGESWFLSSGAGGYLLVLWLGGHFVLLKNHAELGNKFKP